MINKQTKNSYSPKYPVINSKQINFQIRKINHPLNKHMKEVSIKSIAWTILMVSIVRVQIKCEIVCVVVGEGS